MSLQGGQGRNGGPGEGTPQQNAHRWVSQGFVILHSASLVAAFGFLAETWGELPIWLLQCVVTTGWIHFAGVMWSLYMIHRVLKSAEGHSSPPHYHFRKFIVPAFLLLVGWGVLGSALMYAAWIAPPESYYDADGQSVEGDQE